MSPMLEQLDRQVIKSISAKCIAGASDENQIR